MGEERDELLVVHPNRRKLVLELCCGLVGAVIGSGLFVIAMLWEMPARGYVLWVGGFSGLLCLAGSYYVFCKLRWRGPLLVIGAQPFTPEAALPEGYIAADEIEAIVLYRDPGGPFLGFRLRDPDAVLSRLPPPMRAFYLTGLHRDEVSFCLHRHVLPMGVRALGNEIHERFGVSRGIAPDPTLDTMP
jgi:hypothetical protein